MPLQAVETERVYRQIAAQLATLIASGELPPGARLPSERDLARQMGVSRPSVRQALISLELEGRVRVQVGVGVFVASPPPVTMVDPAIHEEDPRALLLPRWLIESEIAMEAARNALPQDIEVVRAAVTEMARCQEQSRDTDASDRRFHLGIAEATHNRALVLVAHNLWEQCRGGIWKHVAMHFQTPEHRSAVLQDHRAILDALESRNGRQTRAAVRRHLKRLERELRRGWQRVAALSQTPAETVVAVETEKECA